MYTLTIVYPVWVIDYETFRGKQRSFSVSFGPFNDVQQARWFWLTVKEKMQRTYDIVAIHDENGKEYYIDEQNTPM
jgi:hypothetical protein